MYTSLVPTRTHCSRKLGKTDTSQPPFGYDRFRPRQTTGILKQAQNHSHKGNVFRQIIMGPSVNEVESLQNSKGTYMKI